MNNPFKLIEVKLGIIEGLLLDLTHGSIKPIKPSSEIPPVFGIKIAKEITGYSLPAIYQRTSKNLIPHFRRDGRLLFKKDELYAWMTENRIQTRAEFISEKDEKFLAKRKG